VQAAQATADLLREGLQAIAKEGRAEECRADALAAAEKVQVFSDALAAFVRTKAARDPERLGAAGSVSTSAVTGAAGDSPAGTSFPLREGSGGRVVAQVSPKPSPVTMRVASPSYGELTVTGLARWFPAHTVHAQDCGAVIDGNDCTLTATDHVHIQSASVSFKPLLDRGPGRDALLSLLKNPTDKGIDAFQRAMQQMTEKEKGEQGATQASLPVTQTHLTLVNGSAVAQQGDGSRANVTTHVVVEKSELPVCELFAEDRTLVNAFLESVLDPQGGPNVAAFVGEALRAAGRVDELALLRRSSELHGVQSSVWGLFGVNTVKEASVVVIGTGNTLRTDTHVDTGKYDLNGGLADLGRIRQDANQIRAVQAAASAPPAALMQNTDSAGGSGRLSALLENLIRGLAGTADQRPVEAVSTSIANISTLG
jgi:hypothetical protein